MNPWIAVGFTVITFLIAYFLGVNHGFKVGHDDGHRCERAAMQQFIDDHPGLAERRVNEQETPHAG